MKRKIIMKGKKSNDKEKKEQYIFVTSI